MKKIFKKKLTEKQRYVVSSLIFLFISALLLTWFLEYRYFLNNMWRTWNFVIGSPIVYLFNSFLMWLLLVFLWGLLGSPIIAAGASWILIIILTYIHIKKYYSRQTPLLPEDFQLASQASTLTKFVDYGSIVRTIVAALLVIFLTIVCYKFAAKRFNLVRKWKANGFVQKHALYIRLLVVALAGGVFFICTDFVRHNDGARYEDIPILGTHFTAWNQNRNYDDNGFILGFLYNFQKLKLEEPDIYSADKIQMIKSEYDTKAEEENLNRKDPAKDDVNVVVILNESFYDPSVEFNGVKFEDYYPHTGGEVLPNLRKIQKKYPSGLMYSLDYGGGTANIEFESLTSLTNYWTNTVPYTTLIPKAGQIPSIAQMLKTKGYKTTAIHPFNGGMYKRNISLANEGFDTFITENEMDYKDHEGSSEYINDRSAYKQTLKVLKESDEKQMIGLITMQNHTPYNAETYEKTKFAVTTDDIDEQKRSEIAVYYQSLHTSDQYLGEFISELDKLDKKVVVLFYGDHSAGLFDNVVSNEEKFVRDLSRVTPYFIYSNYDSGFRGKQKLPTTTPNCMANTMLNGLRWQKDSLYYLVDQVCEAEPILTSAYLEGREINMAEVLDSYELVTYDILGGKKYWMNK
ncbi:MAG: LTA synthase family protein [Candidatus Saccharibacteria bacterium]|nr:LTA synthase family protein [Candidatus Saccharibacteria bacterium]